jgi:hypothetical protein
MNRTIKRRPPGCAPTASLAALLRACVLATVSIAACASATPEDVGGEPQPARVRAALATMVVDNRTVEALAIYYRLTAPPATEVRVGHAPARATARMAPVPAGEALILIARTTAGAELVMPPRTFALDDDWVWEIAADARFITRDGRP